MDQSLSYPSYPRLCPSMCRQVRRKWEFLLTWTPLWFWPVYAEWCWEGINWCRVHARWHTGLTSGICQTWSLKQQSPSLAFMKHFSCLNEAKGRSYHCWGPSVQRSQTERTRILPVCKECSPYRPAQPEDLHKSRILNLFSFPSFLPGTLRSQRK